MTVDLGSVLSSQDTITYFKSHFPEFLKEETFADPEQIMDITQWSSDCGRVVVRLVSIIGEGHFVPFGGGQKTPLSIGPRRGAVHAPFEGWPSMFSYHSVLFPSAY